MPNTDDVGMSRIDPSYGAPSITITGAHTFPAWPPSLPFGTGGPSPSASLNGFEPDARSGCASRIDRAAAKGDRFVVAAPGSGTPNSGMLVTSRAATRPSAST